MLIENNNPAVNDIAAFRLINGDEVIGKVTSIDANQITITKPVVVQAQVMPNGQVGIGFAPYMASAAEDAKFRFPTANLLNAPLKAQDQMKATYIKMTTGLDIAPASGLAPNGLVG